MKKKKLDKEVIEYSKFIKLANKLKLDVSSCKEGDKKCISEIIRLHILDKSKKILEHLDNEKKKLN